MKTEKTVITLDPEPINFVYVDSYGTDIGKHGNLEGEGR